MAPVMCFMMKETKESGFTGVIHLVSLCSNHVFCSRLFHFHPRLPTVVSETTQYSSIEDDYSSTASRNITPPPKCKNNGI